MFRKVTSIQKNKIWYALGGRKNRAYYDSRKIKWKEGNKMKKENRQIVSNFDNTYCMGTEYHYSQLKREGYGDYYNNFKKEKFDYFRLDNTLNNKKSICFGNFTIAVMFGKLEPYQEQMKILGLKEVEYKDGNWYYKEQIT